MLEPSKPVTLKLRYTPYPAVQLQSDEGQVLRPASVTLRHRYLKQQFTTVPSTSRQRSRALIALPATGPSPVGPPTVTSGTPAAGSSSAEPSFISPPTISPIPTTTMGGSATVSFGQRSPSRSHEIVETSDSSLSVKRGQYAIRDKKEKTVWFYSDGLTYLLEPLSIPSARLGDLYVHTTANRDQQIWLFNHQSAWEKIHLYHPHPTLRSYVVHLLNNGEPRWIQKTTVTTYRGRDKRFQQVSSQNETEAAPTSSGMASRLSNAA